MLNFSTGSIMHTLGAKISSFCHGIRDTTHLQDVRNAVDVKINVKEC